MAENGRYESVSQKLDRLEDRLQEMAVHMATLTANSIHLREALAGYERRFQRLEQEVEARLTAARATSWGVLQWAILGVGTIVLGGVVSLLTTLLI